MRRLIIALAVLAASCGVRSETGVAEQQTYGLAIHGGAGTLTREKLTPEVEKTIRAKLSEAMAAGHGMLADGGTSLDAVVATLRILEDSPLFNAGKGAVYTWEETHELDASLMTGHDKAAGAVAGVRNVRNPIELARRVMEDSPHVMLAGEGAEAFARKAGVELVDNSYFDTDFRFEQLQRARERAGDRALLNPLWTENKFGTVGAVAVDRHGNLAAGTSTGGTTAKRWGRIGDSPVIGAGTYADERCAISATGHGEYFIRYTVAHDVCARMAYLNVPLAEAADTVVNQILADAGGDGGIIAIDRDGNVAMPFNTRGMYRGYRVGNGDPVVQIFAEE